MASNLRIIGYNIKSKAEEANLGITEIANICGLSLNDIQRVYEGRLLLTYVQLCAIADALRCNTNQLLVKPNNFISYGKSTGNFKNSDNEDVILNIIDDYIDLVEALT